MQVAVRLKDGAEARGYVVEWRINPNPCMQINSSSFVDLSQETRVGINFEIQDLDEKEKGDGNWSNFHHIDYWTHVESYSKTALKSFGTLIFKPEKMLSKVKESNGFLNTFELSQNYPNPFNPSTTLNYRILHNSEVVLTIYNAAGHMIKSLLNAEQTAGTYSIMWDGTDDHGLPTCSGVYFFKMTSANYSECRKALLVR